jgi:hypothetical protein
MSETDTYFSEISRGFNSGKSKSVSGNCFQCFRKFGDFLREFGKDGWEISASSRYPAGTDYFGKREITSVAFKQL